DQNKEPRDQGQDAPGDRFEQWPGGLVDSNSTTPAVTMATKKVGRPNLKSNVDAVSSTAAESAMPSAVHRPERVNTGRGMSTAIASRSAARCARRNTRN